MHPPLETPLVSGSAYFVVGREYIGYVSENEKIKKFMEWWVQDTYSPDEYLWALSKGSLKSSAHFP